MPTIPLSLYPLSYPAATARFLAESWWTCYSSPPHTWRQRSDAILATEQPISVMPRTARNGLDPVITPAPAWKGFAPAWLGVPCRVGRVTLSLPIYGAPGQFHSLSLLTLFPQQDVPDAPPYIQLGAQFLLEYHIEVVLNESATGDNRLVIP
jgi:hypothetical protein